MQINELLRKNEIQVHSKEITKNILNKEKIGICPMEKKALEIEDNEKFFIELLCN